MTKTYEGLSKALKTASNIIMANSELSWEELCGIFCTDVFIEPYYFDVIDILVAGRQSKR